MIPIDEEIIFTESDTDPEAVTVSNDAHDRLVEHVRKLQPAYRMMLEMRYIEELTNKEIAERLGVSQSVVSTRIARARKVIMELFEKEGVLND